MMLMILNITERLLRIQACTHLLFLYEAIGMTVHFNQELSMGSTHAVKTNHANPRH